MSGLLGGVPVKLVFVSTGLNAPTKRLCLASVKAQTIACEHVYIESRPDVTNTQNWYEAIQKIDPAAIVALLDGDDWLADGRVADVVIAAHNAGALVTYGNYMTSDGDAGCCAPYQRQDYRCEPWFASHLKTFRAGLFHRLTPDDLQVGGKWLDIASDVAVMLPLMEMAGPERVMFCKDVLYIYYRANSFEINTDQAGRMRERELVAAVRAKPVKGRVEL